MTFTSDPEGATVPEGTSATIRVVDATGLPAVTIAADDASVTEESGEAGFTLTRTEPLTEELTVTVELKESYYSDVLPDEMVTLQANYDQTVERTVTFAADAATAALAVPLKNDELAEGDADFTVEVKPGDGYTVGGTALATVTVTDASDPGAVKPEHLQAIVGPGVGEVVLFWAAPRRFYEVSRHEYHYKTDGVYGDWVEIPDSGQSPDALTAAHRSGYAVTGLTGGQTHTFEVRAVNVVSGVTTASAASNEAMSTPRTAALEVSFGESDYTVDEGGTVEVTVRLNGVPGRQVTVPVSAAGAGGATPPGETGADWSGVPESVTFGALAAAQTFTLAATDDADAETIESVALSFGALPDGMTAGTPSEATVTIVDNETPVVTIAGDMDIFTENNGAVYFTLSRVGSTAALMVTVEVTQQEDRDLLPDGATSERTVTFAVGSATTALRVTLKNDDFRELAGNIIVEVQAGMGYTVGDPGSASAHVIDIDTGLPTPANLMASLGAEVGEVALSWDAHAAYLIFNRHQYRYKTDGDYPGEWTDIPNSGQHDTDAGDGSNLTGYTVTGLVGGQLHTFQVRTYTSSSSVSDPSNEATVTIVDNDVAPIVVTPSADALVSNVGQDQSTTLDGGSVAHERQVAQAFTTGMNEDGYTLTGVDIVSASSTGFTAHLCPTNASGYPTSSSTESCTPLDPGSFGIGKVSFTPQTDSTLTKGTTYAVVLTVDTLVGGFYTTGWSATDSTGEDTVSAAGWSIADGHLLREFKNNLTGNWNVRTGDVPLRIAIRGTAVDGTSSTPTLSVDDRTGFEDDEVVDFWAQLKDADGEYVEADADVTVTWTASFESGDTAVAADLGSTTTGTLTIEGGTGATSTLFSVMIEDDALDEDDETFTVTLSGASASAQLASDPTAKGTIVDDDDPPTLSVGDATATEGDPAEFTVTLSAVSGRDVTVDWATSVETGDTATSDTDFTAASGTLTIPAGNETGTVMVVTVEDTTVEDDETFTVTLSNATNAAISDATATGTITNDDAADTTCTLNTGDLWCGDVTVGTSSDGVGFVAAETETDTDVGALTDNNGDQTITIGSDGYTIPSLLVLSGARAGTLAITLDKSFPTDDVNTLEFYTDIGTKTFKVSEATAYPTGHGYFWADSDLTWSDGGPDATLRLRRALPVVTIAADNNSVIEEQRNAGFTLSRTGSTAAELTVTVEVTQQVDRDYLPDGAETERTVTFAVNSATAALRVALENDDLAEATAALTVEVQAGSDYTVGDPASATVTVLDGDTGRPTPANLTASAGAGAGEVALSWDAHAPQLVFTRHQYRYKTDGNYAAWTDIPNSGQHATGAGDGSNLTGYTVTGLVGGQEHTFQVRTHFAPDASDPSDEATATPRSAAVSFGAVSYSVDEGGTV